MNFGDAIKQQSRVVLCNLLGGPDSVPYMGGPVRNPTPTAVKNVLEASRRWVCDENEPVPDAWFPQPPSPEDCHDGQEYPGGIRINISSSGFFPTCVRKYEITNFNDNQGIYSVRLTNCDGSVVTTNTTVLEPVSIGCCDGQNNPLPGCDAPPIPEYVSSPVTVNIEYQNNQDITINENVDIEIFAPQVNLIGGIFAPIVITGNTFNLVGTLELTPEFKVNLSPEINIGFGGGNTDNPAPNPGEPFPEPTLPTDERRVIVGAIVTATSVSDRQDFIPQGGNPDIGIPNLGYIAFYIATDNARAWTSDIPIKNVRSYIPCPVTGGAVDVVGTPRGGISIDVQPVWGYPGQHV